VGELEYACKENRLSDLEGFGEKTQEKILLGIGMLKKYSERHLISTASESGQTLFEQVKNFPGVVRCEIAGSLRRRRETIKDIDILVSAADENREKIMDRFSTLPEVEVVSGKGKTKTSVVLQSGMNADLRIVSDEQYPYALHHFTGSKEHNVAMRGYAQKLNMKMNEYGLFRNETENIPCRTEAEIFGKLKMQYIPPELRENYGEIEAALGNEIPELVEQKDLRGMIHCHSHYSDGANTVEEMARACREAGYEYLVISDHSKSAAYANGLSEERIRAQHREIDELNGRLKDFRILKSIECDILPDGRLDYSDEVLAGFDLVIASIHSKFKMTEEEGTRSVIRAMENPFVTIVGHPTGRLLLAREGYPIDMEQIIRTAADLQVSIELNANPHRLDIDWRLIKGSKDLGVKISINPDAHRTEGIQDVKYGVGVARKGWLTKPDVLNCLSAEELIRFAAKRRAG
ncbi:MAG: DNA polymerase/3'-5' exonuclease PolX, partial [Calditrichia bacterium]